MTTTYYYVVLRLAPDPIRGEIINVGVVLFATGAPPRIITLASLNKLRAIDQCWDTQRLSAWIANIQSILDHHREARAQIQALSLFGFCEADTTGMFTAQTVAELSDRISDIKTTYISRNTSDANKPHREKRTRLQSALREQFKKMHILGTQPDDLCNHLVVANVPVPGYDELKSDFVYKNSFYRLTQTIDYNVAPDSMHNKLAETCVKSTAVELAVKEYGPDTMRLAVVDIPSALADAAESHIGLLQAKGFEVFHFGDPYSMTDYLAKAAPAP